MEFEVFAMEDCNGSIACNRRLQWKMTKFINYLDSAHTYDDDMPM